MDLLESVWTVFAVIMLVWLFYQVYFLRGRVDAQTEAIISMSKALQEISQELEELQQAEIHRVARRTSHSAPSDQSLAQRG